MLHAETRPASFLHGCMRITHNLAALNAQGRLIVNQSNASKTLEKRSTGMRINRAGDDAAGLVILEKMRGHIRGLDQAARNAQDSISLIQTADGEHPPFIRFFNACAISSQNLGFSTKDLRTNALGLTNVSVATLSGASTAISTIDSAIGIVSSARSCFGAVQNRLEHAAASLSVTNERMAASESRIHDADMAKEMMAFTRDKIFSQDAQAMLAQANQQPQGVLQLLQQHAGSDARCAHKAASVTRTPAGSPNPSNLEDNPGDALHFEIHAVSPAPSVQSSDSSRMQENPDVPPGDIRIILP